LKQAIVSTIWLLAMGPIAALADSHSTCYGTTSNGRVANACELPAGGTNYSPYSTVARWLGRTWVHCDVAQVIVSAYDSLAKSHPDKQYVYGETGFRTGGEFKPHKTHRNGLSVDFMTPVTNTDGKSVPLPTSVTNKYGYAIEFDSTARYEDLRIDFEAIAAHLAALKQSAEAHGIGIWRVILDPELQPYLHKTKAWPEISDMTFSRKRSWVRHDDHYHVDFTVDCRPLSEWAPEDD
jgi:penicillin-insensitive murein endopeptidase